MIITTCFSHRGMTSVSPREVLGTLRRQKGKASLCCTAILAATAAVIVFWPRSYRSEAKLFVRLGRESVTLDPTATIGQTMPISDSRENEINSVLEIVTSRDLAERVVDSLGPQLILDPTANADGKNSSSADNGGWGSFLHLDAVPVTERERAVTRLVNTLEAWTPRRTDVVGLRYSAATPDAAQKILAKVVDIYREEHVRAHRTEHSYSFLEDQKQLLQYELQKAYDSLRDAKNRAGLSSIESQQLILQQQLRAIDADVVVARAELAASDAKVAALKCGLDTLPAKLVTQDVVGFSNQAADLMRDTLFKLQARQAELQAKFSANHPEVVAVNEQIQRLQHNLDQQPDQRTQSTTSLHTGHQQLELSLLTERANLSAFQARIADLDAQRTAALASVKELNGRESLVVQAQRQVELLESNYRKYADKLEQARIDRQLESQQISNVNVIQPASYVAKAASPNRLLVLALGLILALASSVLVCLVAEAGARPLRTTDDQAVHERPTANALQSRYLVSR